MAEIIELWDSSDLRAWRGRRGLRMSKAAELFGVSRGTLYVWENKVPPVDISRRAAKIDAALAPRVVPKLTRKLWKEIRDYRLELFAERQRIPTSQREPLEVFSAQAKALVLAKFGRDNEE